MKTPELRSPPPAGSDPKKIANSDCPTRRAHFSLQSSQIVAIGLLALVFYYFSTVVPLAQNEIWAHLKYGEWIVAHGALPEQELFSPFADPEATYGNMNWVSQVTFYLVYHSGEILAGGEELQRTAGGVQMLRTFHALLMVLKVGLVMLALRRSVRSLPLAVVGAVLLVVWTLFASEIAKPQLIGEVLFAFLLWWLSAGRLWRWTWLVLGLLFAVWVNCHPSFLAGLSFLGVFWLGRLVEYVRSRPARRKDQRAWLGQGLAALALALLSASFLNPAGPEIYSAILEMALHPNMLHLPDWQSTEFALEDVNFLATLLVLVLSQAASPRALPPAPLVVLLVFVPLGAFLQGLLPWWMMLAPWCAVILWRDLHIVARRRYGRRWVGRPSLGKTILAVLLLAATFLGSGGLPVPLGRQPPALAAALAPRTLWQLARQLQHGEGLPALAEALGNYPHQRFQGRMLVPFDLADYLLWSLPAKAPLLVYSQAQYFPEQHWQDQIRALSAAEAYKAKKKEEKDWPSWQEILKRHGVNLIVIDAEEYIALAKALRADPAWQLIVQESKTKLIPFYWVEVKLLIAVRKHPL